MHTRSRATATALLLTASACGLATTTGSAHATTTHPSASVRATTLTVTLRSTKSGPKVSAHQIRPGKTMFKVVRGGVGGSMQVLRLKPGYSLQHALGDFAKAFPSGNTAPDVKAVRRVDKNVVFYGGMDVPAKGAPANWWGVDIDKASTYYVVNIDKNSLSSFKAKGHHQKRSLPTAKGSLGMASAPGGANVFTSPATDPHRGWMKTTDRAEEPHFIVLQKVKESTTKKDVQDALMSPDQPTFFLNDGLQTGVISPGHTFEWKYGLSKGKYLSLCFWPSKIDGTPHALMGMFRLFHLA